MRAFCFLLVMMTLAGAEPPASRAVVVRPVANLFSAPTEDADVVSQAIYGTSVRIQEEKGEWAKVQTPDEYTGWAPLATLRRLGANDRPYASAGPVLMVNALYAHLYREPDLTKHQPVLTVPYETRLEVVSPLDRSPLPRWLQVRLADDRAAWVQSGDLTPAGTLLNREEMLIVSKRFLGLPYTWGGTSSFGFDCSGFTQMLCRRRGILMPRDAGPQARWNGLVPVDAKQDLQPGDLLYFGESEKKITHTGLYMGTGEFIHATTHVQPVVQISRLDDAHWTRLLVAMRRPK